MRREVQVVVSFRPKALHGLIFLMVPLVVAVFAWQKPLYNWDLVPYIGSVLSREGYSSNQTHALTYKMLRRELPAQSYRRLIEAHSPPDGDYAWIVMQSSESFHQQLPFFNISWLYIALLQAIHRVGVSIVRAVSLVSIASYLGLCFLIFSWCSRFMQPWPAMVMSWCLSICPSMLQLPRIATPDPLSAFVLVLAVYLLLAREANGWFFALSVVSIWIRPDNLIVAGFSFAALWLAQPKRWRLWFGGMLSALAAYELLQLAAPGYSWAVLFYHSFVSHLAFPAGQTINLTARMYLHAFGRGVIALGESSMISEFLLLGTIGLLAFNCRTQVGNPGRKLPLLAGAMLLSIVVHFLLYPMVQDRFFIAEFIVLAFAGLSALSTSMEAFSQSGATIVRRPVIAAD